MRINPFNYGLGGRQAACSVNSHWDRQLDDLSITENGYGIYAKNIAFTWRDGKHPVNSIDPIRLTDLKITNFKEIRLLIIQLYQVIRLITFCFTVTGNGKLNSSRILNEYYCIRMIEIPKSAVADFPYS
ncbi:MAG: hypothetical protein ACLR6O_05725 [Eubacterium sp.]